MTFYIKNIFLYTTVPSEDGLCRLKNVGEITRNNIH